MPPLHHPQIINECIWNTAAMTTAKGKAEYSVKKKKTVVVSLCPPQVPHGLSWDQTWSLQTAIIMAKPEECHPSPSFCLYIIAMCSNPHTVLVDYSLSFCLLFLTTLLVCHAGYVMLTIMHDSFQTCSIILSNLKTIEASDLAVTCHG
jgi:hypothetical protein